MTTGMRGDDRTGKNEVRDFRRNLVQEVGRCEVCGHDPRRAKSGFLAWAMCVHEIARGANRQKAMDKRFAVLVLCWHCHEARIHGSEDWPEARQLAVLMKSRPKDYDLVRYNKLIGRGPNRITQTDVDKFKWRHGYG